MTCKLKIMIYLVYVPNPILSKILLCWVRNYDSYKTYFIAIVLS